MYFETSFILGKFRPDYSSSFGFLASNDFSSFRYDKISDDQEFPYELKSTAHKIIIALANRYESSPNFFSSSFQFGSEHQRLVFCRVKEVDWIPYFTTQLVDDLATHLRLFKQARAKLKSAKHGNLETYFFDLEFALEHGVICRDHICMNAKEEKGNLHIQSRMFLAEEH